MTPPKLAVFLVKLQKVILIEELVVERRTPLTSSALFVNLLLLIVTMVPFTSMTPELSSTLLFVKWLLVMMEEE